jgi:uncharacterized protein YacL
MLLYIVRFLFVITITAFLFMGIASQDDKLTKTQSIAQLHDTVWQLGKQGKFEEAYAQYQQVRNAEEEALASGQNVMAIFLIGIAVAIIVVAVDWFTPKKSLNALAGIFFGLLVGVLISWAMSPVLKMMNELYFHMSPDSLQISQWIMGICICYLVISMVIQTKDDVRFVIPYVEFSRQAKGLRPLVLDTSVIIDGRIADICDTRLFDAPLVIPRFILNELQLIADSADKLKRNRGRRGLDMLNRLQISNMVEVIIDDTPPPGLDAHAAVDHKLVAFSKNCDGRLVTNDFNLNKVAQLRGVDVININDLANAMKTVTLPGEPMKVKIIRAGDEATQGIGYLDDGTMVVVEEARDKIGQTIHIAITSSIQTSAGKMIFGKFEGPTANNKDENKNSS